MDHFADCAETHDKSKDGAETLDKPPDGVETPDKPEEENVMISTLGIVKISGKRLGLFWYYMCSNATLQLQLYNYLYIKSMPTST